MKQIFIFILILFAADLHSQGEPWKHPLKICRGNDGLTFSNIQTFQDSAGVPCMIRLPSGLLACMFQWFRQPQASNTWDRVAVKFSGDEGITWTQPQPIVVNGLPANFTRPFDPTLAITDSGKIRLYFSDGINMILDTSVNTYSAISDDGINFTMEQGFRFSLPDRPVLDPAVIKFNNLWHLVNPVTGGGTGAYHNISNDGINFIRVVDIASDASHSWIGNFMIKDTNELRFYGSGMMIWYSTSTNGGAWSGYTGTNISGGDPSVLKLSDNNYIMIYTGPPYPTPVSEITGDVTGYYLLQNYPNPFNPVTNLEFGISDLGFVSLKVYDVLGNEVMILLNENKNPGNYSVEWNASNYPGGIYFYRLKTGSFSDTKRMILLK